MAEGLDPVVCADKKLEIVIEKFKKRLSDESCSDDEFRVNEYKMQRESWQLEKERLEQEISEYNEKVPKCSPKEIRFN